MNKPNIEFTADGDLKNAELKIMNLRPSGNAKNLVWEEVCFRTFTRLHDNVGQYLIALWHIFCLFLLRALDWRMEIMGNTKTRYS